MNESYNREATVVTPEHVRLHLQTAGLGSRAAALIADMLLLLAAFGIVSLLTGLILIPLDLAVADLFGEYAIAFLIVFAALLTGAYYALAEYYMAGQTFGKRWLGLRVVQENGQPVTFLSALIRNFFRLIDFMPSFYIAGALWMFFHPLDKRLGDLAAGTIVVRDLEHERRRIRHRTQKWLDKWRMQHRFSLTIPDAARGKVEREDWLLLAAYAERLPSLDRRKRDELAWRITQRLLRKLELDLNPYTLYPAAFLVELYILLSEEWSL